MAHCFYNFIAANRVVSIKAESDGEAEIGPTDEEWIVAVNKIAAAQSRLRDQEFTTVRAALAEAYKLMAGAGARPDDLYARITESRLQAMVTDAYQALATGDWQWLPPSGDIQAVVTSLAVRVRALDRLLAILAPYNGPPVNAQTDYLCGKTNWFVIPRLTARVPRPGYGGRASFSQRGTLYHRLLPRMIGSYEITLTFLPDIRCFDPKLVLGSAMFEDFGLNYHIESGTFHAIDIQCDTSAQQIGAAIGKATAARCYCVAWPELTMRRDVELKTLIDGLKAIARSDAQNCLPAFTLAGSWHVGEGEQRRNVAPVLDAYGETLLEHSKARAYSDNEYGLEGIYSDYRIPVLVTQDRLVAFAICKDFCDTRNGIPYPLLNVDLIVVSSIGNEQTMASHRAMATRIEPSGTGAFVVQQDLETAKGETGWVSRPGSKIAKADLVDLRRGAWSVA